MRRRRLARAGILLEAVAEPLTTDRPEFVESSDVVGRGPV
jgi:hypothetical protein